MSDDINLNSDDQEGTIEQKAFNADLIRKYPRANRRISLAIAQYGIKLTDEGGAPAGDGTGDNHSTFISPHGVEFRSAQDYPAGTLLKIEINLPDYWERKQRFVDYGRVDRPQNFHILAKVVKTEDVGKRGKKKMVIAQTVIIDEVDEQVLKSFLQEG